MGIRFILMVNKQGQTRLAQYYEYLTIEERRALEGEIVRKCLARNEQQVGYLYPDRSLLHCLIVEKGWFCSELGSPSLHPIC